MITLEASAEKQPRPDEALWNVALVLLGATLDPEAVSRTLGLAPTKAWLKGDRYTTTRGSFVVRKSGLWSLSSRDTVGRREEPGSISERIMDLLSSIPFRGNIREAIPELERCRISIFYGAPTTDESWGSAGFLIDPSVSKELSQRGLELYLEVFLSDCEGDQAAG